jgi:hypothetical protein
MKLTRLRRAGRTPVACALGGGVVGGLAAASVVLVSASVSAPNVVNGCYTKTEGLLRAIDNTQTCSSADTLLKWNQTGARGSAGQAGPQGGISGYEVQVGTFFRGKGKASCSPGKRVLGGGFEGGNPKEVIYADRPVFAQPNSWYVDLGEASTVSGGAIYVICAS